MDERLNWLTLANKFADDGDPRGMRACARELFDLDNNSPDGPAVMAEAALYSGSLDEAEVLAHDACSLCPEHFRARMVLAGLAANRFELREELSILHKLTVDVRKELNKAKNLQENSRIKKQLARTADVEAQVKATIKQAAIEEKLHRYILFRSLGLLADAEYLAGEPDLAADALNEARTLAESRELEAELYSKHLFLRNYRDLTDKNSREMAETYQAILGPSIPYKQDNVLKSPEKKLRIGYISPDFRQHAVANFVLPFMRDFDSDHFSVYCYSTGKADAVTDRFRHNHISWRDMRGRPPQNIARQIAEDHIDILVDLSGHSQNNCLPVMALHPANIQICAIGYTATTGLDAMDYFLSDDVCIPSLEQPEAFTERILRLPRCHLCYAPGAIRDIPPAGTRAPYLHNGYITYGSFNNYAKVTDDILFIWRAILEKVEDAHLVIKGKICSIPSGESILMERLQKFGLPLERIELRPYSPDYLEQYRDIDVILDTSPYTGGLTTCEALYMGTPVVVLRGRSHGSRLGASILTSADLSELIAENPMEYIKKAVKLSTKSKFISYYHAGLRTHMYESKLMDSKGYMRDLEAIYREIWKEFCRNSN